MNRFLEEAMSIRDEIISNRRHIHRRPELGFDLSETIEFVATQLESYGYSPARGTHLPGRYRQQSGDSSSGRYGCFAAAGRFWSGVFQ